MGKCTEMNCGYGSMIAGQKRDLMNLTGKT